MKKQNEVQQQIQDLSIELAKQRHEGHKIDREKVKKLWKLVSKARETGQLSSEWFDLEFMTLDQITDWYETRVTKPIDWVKMLLDHNCTEDSTFTQILHHNHTHDVPELCGNYHPDCWGYLYKDPNLRRFLSWPSQIINTPGSTWKNLKFSWIYSDASNTHGPVGSTDLTGRFVTHIKIEQKGPIGIKLVSHATAIGYGGYAWFDPLDGQFFAYHGLYVSIPPSAVINVGNRSVHHDAHVVWRVIFDPNNMDNHTMNEGTCFVLGQPSLGGYAPSTCSITFALKGPTTIRVTEDINYCILLKTGALECPIYPQVFIQQPGLFSDLAPLCWSVAIP
jgi:hypothetical protein